MQFSVHVYANVCHDHPVTMFRKTERSAGNLPFSSFASGSYAGTKFETTKGIVPMAKVLVLYYSMYGHIETMANTIAEGAKGVEGADVVVKRVPETMADQAFLSAGGKAEQDAPVASPAELADYDAIIFGTPTRFGNMAGQMRTFLDQTGGLWAEGKLHGKVASVFTSTGTGGGQEHTISSFWTTLAHHGMVIVPLVYGITVFFEISEVNVCTPYGTSTIIRKNGARNRNEKECNIYSYQGKHVTKMAMKLRG